MEPGLASSATNLDDVWELDCDDAGSQRLDTAELEREWQTRHSKNSTVQEGFNLGYRQAAPAGYNWGVSKGAISAYALLPTSAQPSLVPDEDAKARLQALHSVFNSLSTADALRLYYEDTVQPSSAETSSESMQPETDMDGVADALRSLNISRVDSLSTSNGNYSRTISRLEELERQARSELESNSIELSTLN